MTERTCSFPGCEAKHYARGHCSGHHQQTRDGRTLAPILRNFPDRFWSKVSKTDGCWMWIGAKNHLGYGQIQFGDRRVGAHRISLMFAGVTVPADADVDHLCRNPPCVNPAHLEPVTHAVNMERAPYSARDFQAAKTHCPQGHEYTEGNTYLRRNSSNTLSRECRACRRARRPAAA